MKLPKQKEESVHKQVADYIRMQYRHVIFRTDGGGLRLPTGLAKKFASLQHGRAYPDLFIAEPRLIYGADPDIDASKDYAGLFIELKRPDTKLIRDKDATRPNKNEKVMRKKGDWFDTHIEEQAKTLQELRARGYKAEFAVGFAEAKKIIDDYLKK